MMYLAVGVVVTLLSVVTKGQGTGIGGVVAFSAVMKKNNDYNAGRIVVFETVITNEGNGYDNVTGIFIAPKGGLYQFTVTVLSNEDRAEVSVYKENTMLATAFGEEGSNLQGGNSVIIRVKKGEKVYAKTGRASSLYAVNYLYNSFMGFMIAP